MTAARVEGRTPAEEASAFRDLQKRAPDLLAERDALLAQVAEQAALLRVTADARDEYQRAAGRAEYQVAELCAVLAEFAETVTTDARELARKVMHENNHRVTGTESERIGYLLQAMDRNGRLARAALSEHRALIRRNAALLKRVQP